MTLIQFPLSIAFALNKYFASKDEARYYLRGVNMIVYPDQMILQASNGDRLMVAKCDIETPAATVANYTISSDVFRKIRKPIHWENYAVLDAENNTVSYGGKTYPNALVNGTFPDTSHAVKTALKSQDKPWRPAVLDLDHAMAFADFVQFVGNSQARAVLNAATDGHIQVVHVSNDPNYLGFIFDKTLGTPKTFKALRSQMTEFKDAITRKPHETYFPTQVDVS